MEKRELINKCKYILIFCLATLSLELVAFWSLDFGFLPKYFLFDLAYMLVMSSIIFLIKKRKNKLIFIISLLFIQLLLNCVNACMFDVLGDIFGFDMFKLTQEAAKVLDVSFFNFKAIILNLLFFVLFIILLLELTKTDKFTITKNKKQHSFALVFAFFLLLCGTGLTNNIVAASLLADCSISDPLYLAKSDNYLYENFQFKQEAYKNFGTFGFYLKSLENLLIKDDNLPEDEIKELKEYIKQGIVEENNSAILKDDNLIVIMAESLDWFGIDPYCTPTLYNLVTSSAQSFTNFRARNKTNMSENIAMLGNYVWGTDFTTLARDNNFSPQNSLAYIFRNKGYTANYFHSFQKSFYKRNIVNKDFGYETLFTIEDSGLGDKTTFGDAYLETDFLDSCISLLAPTDKKFFSFYTTFGTHGSYDNFNSRYADYHEFYENHLPEITAYLNSQGFKMPTNRKYYNLLKEYKAAVMDTDKMIANLFEYLENNSLLDNTTIVIFGDHNCYYSDLNSFVRYGTNDINTTDSDIHNIPFMIYSKKLGGQQNDTFCSTYDIYPTICELFGLKYNKNLTQGYNVFSEDIKNTIFISNLSGIFTDNLYSLNILDVYDNNPLTTSEEDIYNFQLNAINFYTKQNKIDKIYLNKLLNITY